MVRINLINPKQLSDQHLIAEYNEILMLLGYVAKHPSGASIPETYRLGKGHILFFKNKLRYLQKRHELLKKEMSKRQFVTNKSISLNGFDASLLGNWKPRVEDYAIIKQRILEKIMQKPSYYRYYGTPRDPLFFRKLLGEV